MPQLDYSDDRSSSLRQRLYPLVPQPLQQVLDVVPLYRSLTAMWGQQPTAPLALPAQGLNWAHRLHLCNFRLWHAEDGVRRPDASAQFIAQSKWAIDRWNQQRHDQIEQLDTWLLTWLAAYQAAQAPHAELHSETPGNLLDRLSILTLKQYYMGHEAQRQEATAAHRQACQQRLLLLTEQHQDLDGCLCRLCVDLWSGRKICKLYRQFKMYNDPNLNPHIYQYRAAHAT